MNGGQFAAKRFFFPWGYQIMADLHLFSQAGGRECMKHKRCQSLVDGSRDSVMTSMLATRRGSHAWPVVFYWSQQRFAHTVAEVSWWDDNLGVLVLKIEIRKLSR